MAFIFLDESGDLGFSLKKKSSKYFVVAFLFVDNKRPLEKIVKKVYRNLKKKVKKSGGGILHAFKEKPITRIRLLRVLSKHKLSIMAIYLNKSKVYSKLQNEKHILYNYVVNILLDRIMTRKIIDISSPIYFIASQRETNKFLNENFKNYLQNQVKNRHKLDISIDIKTPNEEKSLQIIDFVCWSIFKKYEYKETKYYDLIKNLIFEERGLFGN